MPVSMDYTYTQGKYVQAFAQYYCGQQQSFHPDIEECCCFILYQGVECAYAVGARSVDAGLLEHIRKRCLAYYQLHASVDRHYGYRTGKRTEKQACRGGSRGKHEEGKDDCLVNVCHARYYYSACGGHPLCSDDERQHLLCA